MTDERLTQAARSYANCVELLRSSLETTLQRVMMDLNIRNEWKITQALTPPERQFWRSGSASLDSFDKPPQGEQPEGDR